MRTAQRRLKRKTLSEINVVPYIDVMLVLLVIFMITTPLLKQGIQVNLPEANRKTLRTIAPKPIIISVDQKGSYYINLSTHPTEALSIVQLKAILERRLTLEKKQHHVAKVYVKGDRAINYGAVVKAMSLAKTAGAKQIGLVLSQKRH